MLIWLSAGDVPGIVKGTFLQKECHHHFSPCNSVESVLQSGH